MEIWDRTASIYSYVKRLCKIFNSRNVAQEDEFWEKLDEVAINLCEERNSWLDDNLYSPLIDLIDTIVVGQTPHDYDEHIFFGGLIVQALHFTGLVDF